MSLPRAYLVHILDHRLRIRIPTRRESKRYFSRLESELKNCQQIISIKANPLTASLLLSYDGKVSDIKTYAENHQLFKLKTNPEITKRAPQPLSKIISRELNLLDKKLSFHSSGTLDLPSIVFTCLIGATAIQLYRGSLFPPALSLLDSAIRTLRNPEHLHEDVFSSK